VLGWFVLSFDTIHYALIVAALVAPVTLLQWHWLRRDASAATAEARPAVEAKAMQVLGTGLAATEIGYLACAFLWFESGAWAWVAAALGAAWLAASAVPRLGPTPVCLFGVVSWPALLLLTWAFPDAMATLGFLQPLARAG